MAELDLKVRVDVSGERDVDGLSKSFDDAGAKADGMSKRSAVALGAIGGFAASAGLSLASAGIDMAVEAIGNSISLASDKAEAASKVNTLYGESASKVSAAAASAADTVNLSSGKYLAAAGNLGNLTRNMGLSEDASADMSIGMIQLAADMGSFNNASPEDVLKAMQSALTGETEPMKKFGVMLDEATIKQKAVEMGLYDGVGALSKSGKAQATYQLLLDQTGNAQGDLARTSDSLANKQAKGAAKQEEAWTKLGEAITPLADVLMPAIAGAITAVVEVITAIIAAISKWMDENKPLIDMAKRIGAVVLDVLKHAFDVLLDVVGKVIDVIKKGIDWFGNLWSSIKDAAGKITGVISGLFDPLSKSFDKVIDTIKGGWNTFARFWNSIGIDIPEVRIPNPLGGDIVLGGGKFSLPNLPVLDQGGIVSRPTLALLAANSRPEAIVPLDRAGGRGAEITINVYAGVGDPVAIGREVVAAVRSFERANGPAWAPAS